MNHKLTFLLLTIAIYDYLCSLQSMFRNEFLEAYFLRLFLRDKGLCVCCSLARNWNMPRLKWKLRVDLSGSWCWCSRSLATMKIILVMFSLQNTSSKAKEFQTGVQTINFISNLTVLLQQISHDGFNNWLKFKINTMRRRKLF